jgi:hypothetical protein
MWNKISTWWTGFAPKLPFGNSPALVPLLILVVALFIAGFVKSCHAAEFEFTGAYTALRGPASAMGAKVIVPDLIGTAADGACGFMLIGASTYEGVHQIPQAVAHCQLLSHVTPRFSVGIGLAKLQHADAYNSGAINFSLELEYRVWRQIYVGWQHFSNSGTSDPNLGRDLPFIAVRWPFQ